MPSSQENSASSYLEFHSARAISVDETKARELLRSIKNDPMGGWFTLPETYDRTELAQIKSAAKAIQSDSDFLVCIGIGGSYLGHRAIIEALQPKGSTKVLYIGNSLSARELSNLLNELGDHDFSINVISKSGTTTEPAIAFRFLKEKLMAKYGDEAFSRIYATTDTDSGALHDEAVKNGYTRFVVPDDIGGRYSVLTAVGLLPLAVAGVDVDQLLAGAAEELSALSSAVNLQGESPAQAQDSSQLSVKKRPLKDLPLIQYAFARHELQQSGFDTEVLAAFEPCLHEFEEWWKQLFGESEGKQGQGIFPASVIYTTDLHSLGQYLQDGRRNIFETVLEFVNPGSLDFSVPISKNNLDGLAYLEGKKLSEINQKALEATVDAHRRGGIPVFEVIAPTLDARSLGHLVFFFEVACALSAKLSGVNPFDQPGVEAYKTRMFELLGKPGYKL